MNINQDTSQNNLNFNLDLYYDFLTTDYSSSFNFKLCLKRGSKVYETKNTMKYESPGKKDVIIRETISFVENFVPNEQEEKIYKIYLQVYTKQGFKNATFAELNLSSILKGEEFNNFENKLFELDFVKHPFSFLKLKINLSGKIEKENLSSESIKSKEEENLPSVNVANSSSTGKNFLQKKPSIEKENISISNSVNNVTVTSSANSDQINNQIIQANEEIFFLNEKIKVLNSKVEQLETEKIEGDKTIKNLENNISTLKNQVSANSEKNEKSSTKDSSVNKRVKIFYRINYYFIQISFLNNLITFSLLKNLRIKKLLFLT
jgi:hypothetical protein